MQVFEIAIHFVKLKKKYIYILIILSCDSIKLQKHNIETIILNKYRFPILIYISP